MAFYDAFITKFNSLVGDDQVRLDQINAETVAGPRIDVPIGKVVGFMALQGVLAAIQAFAVSPPNGADPTAVIAARELVTLVSTPSITSFSMSDPNVFAAIKSFLDALVASNVLVQAQEDALLGLSATSQPWNQSNGYDFQFTVHDLVGSGLVSLGDAITKGYADPAQMTIGEVPVGLLPNGFAGEDVNGITVSEAIEHGLRARDLLNSDQLALFKVAIQ